MTHYAAERALREIALGRRNWTLCGSGAGVHRAAAVSTVIETAKLNDVDPQTWLADVFARLPDHLAQRLDELLQWASARLATGVGVRFSLGRVNAFWQRSGRSVRH